MKTSNKILFGGLATILLTSIAVMVIGRSNMRFWTKEECHKLPRTSKTVKLEFNKVNIGHSVEAVLKQGDFQVEIDASESAMPFVNHHVENGVLHLNLENAIITQAEPCTFKAVITAPSLDKIFIANGSQMTNKEIFEAPNLEIEAVNGSWVDMIVNVENLKTSASNSAEISIEGDVKNLDISARNSAQIQLPKVNVSTANIYLANSSFAKIQADSITKAVVQNSSTLNYIGEAVLGSITSQNSSAINKVSEEELEVK